MEAVKIGRDCFVASSDGLVQARIRGYDDYISGCDFEDNPYSEGERRDFWTGGWEAADAAYQG